MSCRTRHWMSIGGAMLGLAIMSIYLALSVEAQLSKDNIREIEQSMLNKWLEEKGGWGRLEALSPEQRDRLWHANPCGVTHSCDPGVGGGGPHAPRPTPAPCGVTHACGPGVGLDGGVERPKPREFKPLN